MSLVLTESAKAHFAALIKAQPKKSQETILNLRIQAIDIGTAKANVEISYCPYGQEDSSDMAVDCGNFILYVEKGSELALTNAIIDYRIDEINNAKLHIKAPYLKDLDVKSDNKNISLFDKINFFLQKEINPVLARHNGLVELLEFNENHGEIAVRFSGGCKGCSMVDFTLKNGIEKALKDKFPEILLVKDVTEHEKK